MDRYSFRLVLAAIEEERLDVLQHLLRSSYVDDWVKSEDLIQYAENTDNEEVIAVVKVLFVMEERG